MVYRQVHALFIKQIRKEFFGGRVTPDNMYTLGWGHNGPTVAQFGLKHQSTLWCEIFIINTSGSGPTSLCGAKLPL